VLCIGTNMVYFIPHHLLNKDIKGCAFYRSTVLIITHIQTSLMMGKLYDIVGL